MAASIDRIDQKIDDLKGYVVNIDRAIKDMKKEPFARCADKEARIKSLEKYVSWSIRIVYGAVISALLAGAVSTIVFN